MQEECQKVGSTDLLGGLEESKLYVNDGFAYKL